MTEPAPPAGPDSEHRPDLNTGGSASAQPAPGGGSTYLYDRPGPATHCTCGALWVDGQCVIASAPVDLLGEVVTTLMRTPLDEWATTAAPFRERAVAAGRADVVEYIDTVLARAAVPRATLDGSVRSPCLPVARGEAWIGDVGVLLPARYGDPLGDGYEYAGAVGYHPPDPGPGGLLHITTLPAIELITGGDRRSIIDTMGLNRPERYIAPSIERAKVWFHDHHLLADRVGRGRRFVLVIDHADQSERTIAPLVETYEWAMLSGRRDECTLLLGEMRLLIDPAVGGCVVMQHNPNRTPVPFVEVHTRPGP